MACWIKKNVIGLVRGDSMWCTISLTDSNGDPYIPDPNDSIRFALKRSPHDPDEDILLIKEIDPTTLELRIDPQDTKDLEFGDYSYDIEITLNNGFRDTFIGPCKFKLLEEIY